MSKLAKLGDGGAVALAGPIKVRVGGKGKHANLSRDYQEKTLEAAEVERLVSEGHTVRVAFGPYWRVVHSVEDEQ